MISLNFSLSVLGCVFSVFGVSCVTYSVFDLSTTVNCVNVPFLWAFVRNDRIVAGLYSPFCVNLAVSPLVMLARISGTIDFFPIVFYSIMSRLFFCLCVFVLLGMTFVSADYYDRTPLM